MNIEDSNMGLALSIFKPSSLIPSIATFPLGQEPHILLILEGKYELHFS